MALIDNLFKGWGSGFLVGVGAGALAPQVIPGLGSAVRPIAKAVIKGALAVADAVKVATAEAQEQLSDLMAEVREESNSTPGDGNGAKKPARH
jgi:L-aminopeptidase/D-esterase-like protein